MALEPNVKVGFSGYYKYSVPPFSPTSKVGIADKPLLFLNFAYSLLEKLVKNASAEIKYGLKYYYYM